MTDATTPKVTRAGQRQLRSRVRLDCNPPGLTRDPGHARLIALAGGIHRNEKGQSQRAQDCLQMHRLGEIAIFHVITILPSRDYAMPAQASVSVSIGGRPEPKKALAISMIILIFLLNLAPSSWQRPRFNRKDHNEGV